MSNEGEAFISDLNHAADFDGCVDILARHLSAMGFARLTYSYMAAVRRADGRWLPPPLTVRNFPQCWDIHWQRYSVHDPYFHACFRRTTSIEWTVVQNSQLTAIQRECVNYLADFGLRKGLTVPIHLPHGKFAFMSAIGDDRDQDWHHRVTQHRYKILIRAHQFHAVAFDKYEQSVRTVPDVRLSSRELQCLRLIARGRTHQQTAKLLERSVDTVKLHLKGACNKLGATNGTHAVAKAVCLGLLDTPSGRA